MNDYIIYPRKPLEAVEWLTLREWAYSASQLPTWASGSMPRNGNLSNFIKTALTSVSAPVSSYLWYDTTNSAIKAAAVEVLNMFGQRYGEHYICAFAEDATSDEKADKVEEVLYLICGALSASYERYEPVLTAFRSKESALMGQISSSSTALARFNDTPQDSGEFSDDAHTTNITQSEGTTLTDGMTPAQRLVEIRRAWRSIMAEWCDYLGALTLEGDNL